MLETCVCVSTLPDKHQGPHATDAGSQQCHNMGISVGALTRGIEIGRVSGVLIGCDVIKGKMQAASSAITWEYLLVG